jgi:uncharacterized protein (TIGR03086 family)
MGDIAASHRRALEATGKIVAGVPAGRWGAPTPCAGWDVRALLNHVVAGNWWAAALSGGATIAQVGARLDGDVLGADALRSYERSAEAAGAAFDAPGALAAPCAVSYGPVPGEVYAGHRFIDVLVHGWDLAVATGQDATIDPGLAQECWAVVEPQLEVLRGSGMFGAAPTDVPAAPAARLLAELGRDPASLRT